MRYLKWRFEQSPVVYLQYRFETGDDLKGYAVVRIQDRFGTRICWVLDLFLEQLGESSLYGDALLALQERVSGQCDFISLILPCKRHEKVIKSAGFRKVPQRLLPHRFFFCVRQNNYQNTDILGRDNWFFSWSLHDVL